MKARLFAVLLVSTLVLTAAAPLALAQVTVSGDNNNAVQYVDCSQVQAAANIQYGDQNAAANDNSNAEIANELNISQNQVNACLGEIGGDPDDNTPPADDNTPPADDSTPPADDNTTAADDDTTASEDEVMANTIPKTAVLPDTGGPSLLSLGVGVALVAGGASLIRFRR
jgi:LPXTG-motif cell wall-anchored protein